MNSAGDPPTTHPRPRVAIFADVQNIYYTTRDGFGRQFNYRALWDRISATGDVTTAFAYAIDSGNAGQLKFQDALRHIGFTVKLKPYIQRADGSAKGDWDVGITIDVLDAAEHVDRIALLSGDGDFDLLVHEIKRRFDVRVDVYGVPGLSANSLVQAASAFHAIGEDLLL